MTEVTTMGELLLEWPEGGHSHFNNRGTFPILFYNYFRTLITGSLIEFQLWSAIDLPQVRTHKIHVTESKWNRLLRL